MTAITPPSTPVLESLETGEIVAESSFALTRDALVRYAGASGDFNPLHTDATYATQVAGFAGVFAHGMLTMGMTSRVLTDHYGAAAVRHLGGRFLAQVWPGDRLVARAEVVAVDEDRATFDIVTSNQDGVPVFRGRGVVTLP